MHLCHITASHLTLLPWANRLQSRPQQQRQSAQPPTAGPCPTDDHAERCAGNRSQFTGALMGPEPESLRP